MMRVRILAVHTRARGGLLLWRKKLTINTSYSGKVRERESTQFDDHRRA